MNDYLIRLREGVYNYTKQNERYGIAFYVLSLNEDGSGIIECEEKERLTTYRFTIQNGIPEELENLIHSKVDYIVDHPLEIHEFDGYYLPIYLSLNIYKYYPDARDTLESGKDFYTTEYLSDESESEIVPVLLNIPEIKEKWMKMHKGV